MVNSDPQLELKIASSRDEVLASQRLRYKVFVEELGATSNAVDHDLKIEADEFDEWCDHLILIDKSIDPSTMNHVIGVYRLLRDDVALGKCGFYSESEFDLMPLKNSGKKLLELGRSCVHPNFRSGIAMFHLWNRLAEYVIEHGIEILFGVASFHGTNPQKYASQLTYLHHHHLAPEKLRVTVREHGINLDMLPKQHIDTKRAIVGMPSLIKAYIRLGGLIGEGAYQDNSFNTIDVCILMDTQNMANNRREYYHRMVTNR